ncbi:MAG: chemotaxis protein CheD [Atribacterota bacterium]|nr:chemotaxis protein CheD [Atribacterota bacterium]
MYRKRNVGMAECAVSKDPEEVLCILGLGSCVGLCLYDELKGVAGLVHILLPEQIPGQQNPFKFADTALPALLKELEKAGARPKNLLAKISGGAKMFSGSDSLFDIGQRNVEAIKKILRESKIPLHGEDTGGSRGRSIFFYVENGKLEIKTLGQDVKVI